MIGSTICAIYRNHQFDGIQHDHQLVLTIRSIYSKHCLHRRQQQFQAGYNPYPPQEGQHTRRLAYLCSTFLAVGSCCSRSLCSPFILIFPTANRYSRFDKSLLSLQFVSSPNICACRSNKQTKSNFTPSQMPTSIITNS